MEIVKCEPNAFFSLLRGKGKEYFEFMILFISYRKQFQKKKKKLNINFY